MIKIIIVTLATLCYVRAQSQCQTPSGAAGQCITITNCPQLLALVENAQRTNEDVKLLKESHCGFDENMKPMVCCQQNAGEDQRCFTPDGKLGTCIGFQSCPYLKSLLTNAPISKDNINYVQSSKCESSDTYSVCCGPPVDPSVRPMRNCQPSVAPPDPRTECCGLDSSSGNRIFGGNVTAIDQYPWLILVEYRGLRDDRIKLLCGGVLISSRYVLTAGHCVAGPVLRVGIPTNVRLGEYDTSTNGPDCVDVEGGGQDCTDGTTIIPIEKIIPHRDYDPTSALRRNDIALLRLSEAAPYNDFIRPICLPQSGSLEKPQTLYAAGWGAVSDTQSFSNVKLHVDLPYQPIEDCQPSYQVAKRRVQLWKGQICAGGVAGKDSCKGDSGGPLMLDNGRIYTVVGIVSFGPTPCGMENVPGVYTKVFEYLPWIRSQMKP